MKASLFDSCKGYIQTNANQPAVRPPMTLPTITISREAGAGAVTIGKMALEILQARHPGPVPWALFDRDLVEKVLEDHHLPKTIKQFMPENVVFELTSAVEEMLGLHPDSWTLVQHTADTILRLASAGHVIIVGRGANIVTARLRNVLHVRFVAPVGQRMRHAREFYNLGLEEAEAYVQKTDRARRRYVKQHFDADIDNPLDYHLTLNTGQMTFENAARLIANAAFDLVSHPLNHKHKHEPAHHDRIMAGA